MKSNKAFSLIEMMMVILVISVLAALVYGGAKYMHQKAIDARCEAQFALVEMAIEAYKNDHGYYPQPYVGKSPPGPGATPDEIIAYKNDSLKSDGAAILSRALVYYGSGTPKNDFGKAYLYYSRDISYSSQNKFMVGPGGSIIQSSKAGSDSDARRIANPNGSVYGYRWPGHKDLQNKQGYDLWVSTGLRTLRNYRVAGDS